MSDKGVFPEPSKVDEVVNFFTCSCASDVKSFLGIASFFIKFMPNFSVYAACLFDLLKKGRNFVWSDDCQKSFDYIKAKVRDPALLVHPLFDRSFVIQCDASDKAIGFMLAQRHNDQLRPPIMFGGRVLTDVEQRYATIDKELLACYFPLKLCEIYILGYDFVVYTDQKPLLCLSVFKDVLNKRVRWIHYMESLRTRLRYLTGNQNVVADFISRNNINDTKFYDVLRFNALELSAASYKHEDLIMAQRNDAKLKQVIEGIESNKHVPKEYRISKSKLFMKNNLFMCNHHSHYLVVCPSELRSDVLDLSHSQWYSGHFGIFKTHKRVLASFWWPGLYSDRVDFITQCEVCISLKPLNRNPGRMGIRSFPSSPMELVSIDFLVDLAIRIVGIVTY